MNKTFWVGVQPSLSETMLSTIADKIASYLGIHF